MASPTVSSQRNFMRRFIAGPNCHIIPVADRISQMSEYYIGAVQCALGTGEGGENAALYDELMSQQMLDVDFIRLSTWKSCLG